MSEHITTGKGFAEIALENRKTKRTFLDDISKIIDWRPVEKLLKRHYKRVQSADGRPAYPALSMFKILLLQRWYTLSDEGIEEAMYDRISFVRFSGLSISSVVPDSTTICRFRNEIIKGELYKKVLKELNRQLEHKGIIVKQGAIVDATIIDSSRRPRKVVNVMDEDRSEGEEPKVDISYSSDVEAKWLRKGNKPYYGYKLSMSTDMDGFIIGGHMTPANESDTKQLKRVVEELDLPGRALILADKGYSSKANRDMIKENGYTDMIMHKASRGKELSYWEKLFNRAVSSIRFKVERSFGTLKRQYRFNRARYLGVVKTEMEFYLNAMAFNIKRAALLVT